MKLQIKKGTTSKRVAIFVLNSSLTTGAGLTGLVFNSANLTWYYWREDEGNVGGTAVTLATATRGTFASGGFIEKDAANLPGYYEIGIPDAALATGAGWVNMLLKGAANMAPVALEIELVTKLVSDLADLTQAQILTDATPFPGASIAAIKAKTDQLIFTIANKLDASIQAAADFVQAAADKVWATAVRAITDKAGFSLTTAQEDALADKVWDELIAGHLGAGSTGEKLNAAASAGDPWGTALPGAYGAGTAGKIVGDNLNATVSSRALESGGVLDWAIRLLSNITPLVVADAGNTATTFKTNLGQTQDDFWKGYVVSFPSGSASLPYQVRTIIAYNGATKFITVDKAFTAAPTAGVSFDILVYPSLLALEVKAQTDKLTFNASNEVKAAIENAAAFAQGAADKVWGSATRTLTSFGTLVADIWANASRTLTSLGSSLVAEIWNALTSGMGTVGSIGKRIADNLDAAVTSRSSHAAADIWSVATRALTDKAGFSLSTAGIQAIWDQLTSGLTAVGSVGKLIVDNLNAAVGGVAASVWTQATRTLTAFGTLISDVWSHDLSTTDEDVITGRKGASVLMAVFKRFYHKVTQSGTQEIVYKADNTTPLATMSTTEGPPQEKGKAA